MYSYVRMKSVRFSRCVGFDLHGVFVFHPADRLGAFCPRAAAVECNTAGAGVRGPAPWKREDLEGFPEKSEKGESLCLL